MDGRKLDVNEHVGKTFDRWFVEKYSHHKGKTIYWLCRCKCGTVRPVRTQGLTSGLSRSCGCLQREVASETRKTHGHSKTPIYEAWRCMVRRCHDPKTEEYPRYGARGISVCDRWRFSFADFLEDMGERPSPEMTIERIDNNGNYEPGNCRWASALEQAQNRCDNLLLTLDGETRTIAAWARETGLGWGTIRYRLNQGWPIRDVLTRPANKKHFHRTEGPEQVESSGDPLSRGRTTRWPGR